MVSGRLCDALQIVGLLAFAFAGSFALAVGAFWTVRVSSARSSAPVYSTWLNANVEDSSVRATVLSMTNVFGSAGEWAGGPVLGGIGNAFGIRAALVGSPLTLLSAPVLGFGTGVRCAIHGRVPEVGCLDPATV